MLHFLNTLENFEERDTDVCDTIGENIELFSGKHFFNIFHLNIRSIRKNFDELLLYIETIQQTNIDIIILSETWMIDDISNFNIPNFDIIYNDSAYNQNDGTIVYIKNQINFNSSIKKLTEINLLEITFNLKNTSFIVTASYRPPSSDLDIYLTELESYFSNQDKSDMKIFIGDININLLDTSDNRVNNYICMMAQLGFFSVINKPTRVYKTSSSLIDHIYVKMTGELNNKLNLSSFIFKTDLTDHYTILLNIDFKPEHCTNTISSSNKYKTFTNHDKLRSLLAREKWERVLQCNDPKTSYDIFIDTLFNCIEKSKKSMKPGMNKNNIKLKPWMTQGLLNSIAYRDHLKQKLNKSYSNELRNEYKNYRNLLNNLIKTTKNEYYFTQITDAQNNYKKIWQSVNEITNNKKSKKVKITDIMDNNNQTLKSDEEKANYFNEFFTNVGKRMANCIEKPPLPVTEKKIYRKESLFFHPVTKNEIVNIISKLKNNTAPGPDEISVYLLKKHHQYLIDPLCHIFNCILLTGKIPSKFKESCTTPIFKSGDKTTATNYRPITVINNIAKMFEKCIKSRMMSYCENNHIISDSQFGFRENLSTEQAVFEMVNSVFTNFQNNQKCMAVFLDLAKAFDTVNYDILFQHLYDIGIRGVALDLISDYLTDRKQVVKINDSYSTPLPVTMGVPQGTVLGPILFLLYINNIFNIDGLNGLLVSYADDTAVIFTGKTWEETIFNAEQGLQKLFSWLSSNLLSLNVDKTKFITFTSTITDQPSISRIKIHKFSCSNNNNCDCSTVEKVGSVKYLGVMVDQFLRWKEHIEYTVKRLRKLIYKFYQLRNILNNKNLLMIYNALAESIIRYCIIIWGGTFKTSIYQVEVIQNTLIKILLKKDKRHSTIRLFSETGLLTVRQIYIYQSILFVMSATKTYVSHAYNTRTNKKHTLQIPRCRLKHEQKFITFIGPKLFNMLPDKLKNISHKGILKKEVRLFILSNYELLKRVFQNE